ncbi:uncharacterized protein LOC130655410 [Hydractinia symbiolongicarpus]|uniref:uncharacterized protein LOC130655410 n=1 Tax=Hydractinia symbiolongicarpus TaxID=13093 RepID=UPI00254CE27E|nr:uncharacterized protein LOC130655410 [Hydractinia symbiolongicarpus]
MPGRRKTDQDDTRLYKSFSFREKLRSTFSHKISVESKTEEIMYGNMVVLGDEGVGKTSLIQRFVDNKFFDNYVPTQNICNSDVKALVECEKKKTLKKKEKSLRNTLRKTALLNSQSKLPENISDNLGKTTISCRCRSIAGIDKKRESSLKRTLSFGRAQMQQIKNKENYKSLKEFNIQLVDTPGTVNLSSPATYRAILSDAKGFLIVCSFDKPSSFQSMKNIYQDIKNMNDRVPIILVVNKEDLNSQNIEDIGDRVCEFSRELDVQWCEVSAFKGIGFKNLIEVIMNETTHYNEQEDIADQIQDYDFFY